MDLTDIGTLKARGRQHRIREDRPPQRAPLERGPVHDRVREVRAIEVPIPQVPLRELRLAEHGPRDVGLAHDHAGEVELAPADAAELALAQVVQLVARGVGLAHLGRVKDTSRLWADPGEKDGKG